jgi:hypothetical protein
MIPPFEDNGCLPPGMSIQNHRQLDNTRKKLQLLEVRYQSLISSPAENAIAPNFTRRSLKKLINQMKEEITRFEARATVRPYSCLPAQSVVL